MLPPLLHARDEAHAGHLEQARRVLALPIEESRLHWHPFGVFAVPLARRTDEAVWVRRLHLWHPDTRPVGEASPYGVHTHSGTARSHVLVGTLHHHLYAFRHDEEGVWREASKGQVKQATLLAHTQGSTHAGMVHTLPANQPHGVTKPPGFAVSLFEQVEERQSRPFTTWTRIDCEPEAPVPHAPVDPSMVLREARAVIEEALHLAGQPVRPAQ